MIHKPRWLFPLLVVLIAASCSTLPSQYYDDGVSDDEYIQAASETAEAQAFLRQYPEADIFTDRSSRLAVDFRYNKVTPASTTQSWEGIRLRVFIDPKDRTAAEAFLDCKDDHDKHTFVEEGLIEYLEQYGINQSCP